MRTRTIQHRRREDACRLKIAHEAVDQVHCGTAHRSTSQSTMGVKDMEADDGRL
jgi:hypothetical protein